MDIHHLLDSDGVGRHLLTHCLQRDCVGCQAFDTVKLRLTAVAGL